MRTNSSTTDPAEYGAAAAALAAIAAAGYVYRKQIQAFLLPTATQWATVQAAATAIGRGMKPEWLSGVMAFETGCTFSPSVKNKVSGATGLIQFMPQTARNMGTTVDALAQMSFAEQMQWVVKYFKRSPLKQFRNLGDVYMVVLWPSGAGKSDDYVLFESPSANYRQNAGLDPERSDGTKKGYITRGDALRQVRAAAARCKVEGQP